MLATRVPYVRLPFNVGLMLLLLLFVFVRVDVVVVVFRHTTLEIEYIRLNSE